MVEDKKSEHGKKKFGTAAIALLVCIPLAAFLLLMGFAIKSSGKAAFIPALYALVIICAIIGIIIALVQRFKEIDSGEEDEARKY